jgi:hypothetical protein
MPELVAFGPAVTKADRSHLLSLLFAAFYQAEQVSLRTSKRRHLGWIYRKNTASPHFARRRPPEGAL